MGAALAATHSLLIPLLPASSPSFRLNSCVSAHLSQSAVFTGIRFFALVDTAILRFVIAGQQRSAFENCAISNSGRL